MQTAIANYQLLLCDADEQEICSYVGRYLNERSKTLAAAFKEHAKLHVSVYFNTSTRTAAATRPCKARLARNASSRTYVGSIFKVVMKHVKFEAVEDETHEVAGKLDIEHIVSLAASVWPCSLSWYGASSRLTPH
jgi:hypothetical protein